MDADETTTSKLIARYNTFTRRPLASDPAERDRIFRSLKRVLGRWLPPDRDARILDVGCGEGNLLSFLRASGYTSLHGFDLSDENVALCHEQGFHQVHRGDALAIAAVDEIGTFDVIFALDLLEHLPKEAASSFLSGARERLSPDGYLIVQTPNMGCVFATFHRYNDLTHEFALTEKSAIDLFMVAGFASKDLEIRPAWHATTLLGRLREVYLWLLHNVVYLSEDRQRPKIPTKNLLIKANRIRD